MGHHAPQTLLDRAGNAYLKFIYFLVKGKWIAHLPKIGPGLRRRFVESRFRGAIFKYLSRKCPNQEFVTGRRLLRDRYLPQRTRLLREIKEAVQSPIVSREGGYGFFSVNDFSQVGEVVAACREIIQERGVDRHSVGGYGSEERQKDPRLTKGDYFFNILTPDDLFKYPVLMDFALNPRFVANASSNMRYLPQLTAIGLKVSPPNGSRRGSQNWHFDSLVNPIKCFLNVYDVGPLDGPFTFLPAHRSREAMDAHGEFLLGRLDPSILDGFEQEHGVRATGPAGTGVICETGRCFHYGSRVQENTRVVLSIFYSDYMNYSWGDTKGEYDDLAFRKMPEVRAHFGRDELSAALLRLDRF